MRIAVTDSRSELGFALATRLTSGGHDVVALDAAHEGNGSAAVDLGDEAGAAHAARALRGCDAAVHLAGHGPGLDLAGVLRAAVSRTGHLVLAMRLAGVRRLVHVSSALVYGRAERSPIAEDAPLRPDSAAGEAQRIAERLAAALARGPGARVTILRMAGVFGGPAPKDPLAAWLRALRGGDPVVLSEGGRRRSAPLCRDDAVAALIAALQRPQDEPVLAINVAGGDAPTDSEFCDLVAELSGRPVERSVAADAEEFAAARGGDLVPDISLARRRLGFAPRPLREWLQAMVGGEGPP